jgi:hypothetical protein
MLMTASRRIAEQIQCLVLDAITTALGHEQPVAAMSHATTRIPAHLEGLASLQLGEETRSVILTADRT